MQIRIQVSKGYIIALTLLIIGLVCLGFGINSFYKSSHVVNLDNLKVQDCISGKFVKGNITSYIVKDINTLGEAVYSGQSQTLISIGNEYIYYTIPIAIDRYISIMVSDKTKIKELENFIQGKGKSVSFEGEIVKTPIDINYAWYEDIKGFKTDNIVSNYVIKETLISDKVKMIYPGIAIIILAGLCYMGSGGTRNLLEQENVTLKNNKITYLNSYNRLNELDLEKKRFAVLTAKDSSLKRSYLYKIPMLIFGVFIFYKFYFWELKIIGILIIVISLKWIWHVFINSGFHIASKIAKTFEIETLYLQMNECSNNIVLLQKELENEKISE